MLRVGGLEDMDLETLGDLETSGPETYREQPRTVPRRRRVRLLHMNSVILPEPTRGDERSVARG